MSNTDISCQEIVICRMRQEHLPEVAALEKEIFSQPWSYQSLKDAIDNEKNCYFCAYIEEGTTKRLAGYCGFWNVAQEGQIYNVAVDARYRRRGIGRRLLQKLLEEGKKAGILSYTLEVRKSNEDAIHMYEHLGFESAGIRKNFYDAPKEDAVIMWLTVQP